jgi:hypothetical protein
MATKIVYYVNHPAAFPNELTYSKGYEVLDEENGKFKIIDDKGNECHYFKWRFQDKPIGKLIGYKMKEAAKPYLNPMLLIAYDVFDVPVAISQAFVRGDYTFILMNVDAINNLKKANVLDLWFDEVKKVTYDIGDWVTISTDTFDPEATHWINTDPQRTFQLKKERTYLNLFGWCYGTTEVGRWLPEDWFRPATKEEIGGADVVTVKLSSGIEVKIGTTRIEAAGKQIAMGTIKNIYDDYIPQHWSGMPWDVQIVGSIKIGCTEVTKEDLELVINTREALELKYNIKS